VEAGGGIYVSVAFPHHIPPLLQYLQELALAEALDKEDYVQAASLKTEITALKAGSSSTIFPKAERLQSEEASALTAAVEALSMDELIALGAEEVAKTEEDKRNKSAKESEDIVVKDAFGNDLTSMLSDKKFSEVGLSEDMIKLVYDHGWSVPSKIQMQSLPIILSHQNGTPFLVFIAHVVAFMGGGGGCGP
jgi:hypothetical protein